MPKRNPEVQKKIDEFIARIKALPNVDLTDSKIKAKLYARLGEKIKLEIEAIDRDEAKRNGSGLFRVVY